MTTGRDHGFGHNVHHLTIGKILADKAEYNGDKPFLTFLPDGRRYSYRDIAHLSNDLAAGLLEAGIGRGCHVAVMLDNCPEQILIYFALGRVGAVAVPINTAAKGAQLAHMLRSADCSVVVADQRYADRFGLIADAVPALRRMIMLGNDPHPVEQGWTNSLFDSLYVPSTAPIDKARFDDLAYICFTSGTTGPSKGVMFHQARAIMGAVSHREAFGHRFDDIFYVCLPTFHINALTGSIYLALMADASVVMNDRFSASRFWHDIRECGATTFNLLGSMSHILWGLPPLPEDARNAVRFILATPVPVFAREFEARYGLRICSGYGLTDYATPLAFTLSDPPSKLGSAGRPRRGWDVRIVDEDDFEVPYGERGEIVMRSDNPWCMSSGYYGLPQASLDSLRNGWFHTGDRGYVDEDGYFYFVDRKKDVIRRRGENISAYEVEQILLTHPDVAEAAVFPVSSDMSEDEVAATIVPRNDAVFDPGALIRFCESRMAYFMVPRFVEIRADLPRTLTEKVEKYRLRAAAEAKLGALWDREREGVVLKR